MSRDDLYSATTMAIYLRFIFTISKIQHLACIISHNPREMVCFKDFSPLSIVNFTTKRLEGKCYEQKF